MKKIGLMIVELVLLLGTFLGVSIVHNDIFVPHSGAYGRFLGKNLPVWITMMFLITSALIALIFQIKKRIVKDRYESIITMSRFKRMSGVNVWISCMVGLFLGLLFISMIKVSYIGGHFPDFENYIDMFMNSQSFLMTIIGLSIIGPLFEEVLFRGLLFNIMRRQMPLLAALLLQAVFYGYCQPNPSVQFISFFLAIVYGILYYKFDSLWATLSAAAMMNTVVFVTKQYGVQDYMSHMPDSILLFIAGTCVFALVSLLASVYREKGYKVAALKMIGNLFLWTFVYSAVYYPFIFGLWNRGVMSIHAISPWLGHNNVIGFIPYDIVAFAVYYYVMKWVNKKDLIKVSNFTSMSVKNAVIISVLGIMMGLWVQFFFMIPYFHNHYPQFDQLTFYLTEAVWPVYFSFLVIHSIYKEIYFRAMIFNVFRTAMPVSVSVLGTGVIYGGLFFNWDVPLTIYASVGALIFSLIFEWYRSIWAPILNEFFVFAAYFAVRRMHLTYGPWVSWAMGISSIAIIGMMIYLYNKREIRRNRKAEASQQAAMVA